MKYPQSEAIYIIHFHYFLAATVLLIASMVALSHSCTIKRDKGDGPVEKAKP